MIEHKKTLFQGLECIKVSNGVISIWITTAVGPRILGLSLDGKENIFADLPDSRIVVDGADDYSLRGGHRLWYGPETPQTTYITDDKPVEITIYEFSIEMLQPVDQKTGIQKRIRITFNASNPLLTVDHELRNLGDGEFELAPWALTMLRAGGRGILPLKTDLGDKYGLQPNRHIVFWPYTNLKSNHLDMHDQALIIDVNLIDGALKVGVPNPSGWLAYALDGELFVKSASYQEGEVYLDRGASSQIYCNPEFIELETLGPVVRLAPGEFVNHQEVWQIYREGEWPAEIKALFDLKEVK